MMLRVLELVLVVGSCGMQSCSGQGRGTQEQAGMGPRGACEVVFMAHCGVTRLDDVVAKPR